jgi:hypothetical protein
LNSAQTRESSRLTIRKRKQSTIDDEIFNAEMDLVKFYHDGLEDMSYDEKLIKEIFD